MSGIPHGQVPLLGAQQQQQEVELNRLLTTLYINLMGVVASIRLREDAEPWRQESTITPATIAREAKELAIAAVEELTGAKLVEKRNQNQ